MSPADLDEYLESIGAISGLPTPPMDYASHQAAVSSNLSIFDMYEGNLDFIARSLSNNTAHASPGRVASVSKVAGYLRAAALPIETAALAFNILSALQAPGPNLWRRDFTTSRDQADTIYFKRIQCPELIILSSLQISSSFMNDQPLKLSSWVEKVAQNSFTKDDLTTMDAHIFDRIEWQLYRLAQPSAIDATLAEFKTDGGLQPAVWQD